ncbi:MAG: chemotaxis protein CheD [Sulfitobacter sp.]
MSGKFVITQGEYHVSNDPTATISTLLGSCVSCCLWDPVAGVGGMNHILLASHSQQSLNVDDLAGANAMELLINDMLKLGGQRSRFQAKAFGGAQMVSGLSNIGPTNSTFLLDYLDRENIPCVSHSLGGEIARQVVFVPVTGAARIKARHQAPVEEVVQPAAPVGNDLELF